MHTESALVLHEAIGMITLAWASPWDRAPASDGHRWPRGHRKGKVQARGELIYGDELQILLDQTVGSGSRHLTGARGPARAKLGPVPSLGSDVQDHPQQHVGWSHCSGPIDTSTGSCGKMPLPILMDHASFVSSLIEPYRAVTVDCVPRRSKQPTAVRLGFQ